jgi:hypothetical protein
MPDLPDNGPDTTRPDGDRIRAELVALRDASEAAFTPPPMHRFRSASRRASRGRAAILAVAATAAAGIGGAALTMADGGPDVAPRPVPTVVESSSAAPPSSVPASPPPPGTSTPSAPNIRAVDWKHVTLVLPPNPDDPHCPTGRTTTNGDWTAVRDKRFYIGSALAVGDLTGDGSDEAVVDVSCTTGEGSGDGSGQLLAVTWRNGAWTGLGYLGPRGNDYVAVEIGGQRLTATIRQRYGQAEQDRTYRWNGQRFVQVAGPTTFPSPPG